MHPDQLRAVIDSPHHLRPLLVAWGLRDPERGARILAHLLERLGIEAVMSLAGPLARLLPRSPDADMAFNNLERFFAHPAGPAQLASVLDNRARPLESLLHLFATSQLFSDQLAQHPGDLDMVRLPLRKNPSADELTEALSFEADAAGEDSTLLRVFRRFRNRQLLRIGVNDIIRDRPLEEITSDITQVADASLQVALRVALRNVSRRFGEPFAEDGRPVRCVVLAFGKLGGEELNYSSDIDLMFVYSDEGSTRGNRVPSVAADEFFTRVVGEVVRLLASNTDRGQAYRIDLRLRPEGARGPLARSLASTLAYYDRMGRTWERQALIKIRPVAGDAELGRAFLAAIEPFVYRKYLTFAEINEIKAMKRRIEHQAARGDGDREVKTGRGGIRDIEFAIQFLQLLNGGDLPAVRRRNTLDALAALEQAGCLTDQELRVLDDSYRFLRKCEHRLQLLFDLQTHCLPASPDERRKLALRMGYARPDPLSITTRAGRKSRGRPQPPRPDDAGARAAVPAVAPPDPLEAFERDFRDKTLPTRHILDHLLHQTFADSGESSEPESDLLLAAAPDAETIRDVLGRYGFRDVNAAYANLIQLGQEAPFLSTRRCRHFLASIAPALLRAVAATPDPDMALNNLEKVSDSLGGKTILWELFSFNQPSLRLYVDLCAGSQYLSEILINNPGMIDELLDSLVLNQPRTRDELASELDELCKGATDLDPILHSFQDKELLRVGVRDLLGKVGIRDTLAALSDIAETILVQVARLLEEAACRRHGRPTVEGCGRACRFAILGMGRLGSREMSYHSDLDLMMIYEADGRPEGERGDGDNVSWFTDFAQRLIKTLNRIGPLGRLYAVDMRLRPAGKSGPLVFPLAQFRRYLGLENGGCHEACAQLWERQALTRARVVYGDPAFAAEVMAVVRAGVYAQPLTPAGLDELAANRERVEQSRSPRDLKRGAGGLTDVEYLVQILQLRHGANLPDLTATRTREALGVLRDAGVLSAAEAAGLAEGFEFLLKVQSRLRIVSNRTLDAVPEAADEVEKLARRLGYESGPRLASDLDRHRAAVREMYRRVLARERG